MPTTLNKTSMETPASDNYRWVMFAVYFVGSFSFAATFHSIPPLLPLMIPELKISFAEAGSLMSLFALPGIVLPIPIGLWADRQRGGPHVLIAAYVVLILGMLTMAVSTSYPMLLAGRLVAGAGGTAVTLLVTRSVSQWFRHRDLGIAMGLFVTAFPIASVLTLSFLGTFGAWAGWRIALLAGPVGVSVALVALLLLYRPAPIISELAARLNETREPLLKKTLSIGRPSWLLGMIWMWFNAGLVSFITFGPAYFTDRGFDLGLAGFVTSIQMLTAPFLAPIIGHLIDRYQRPTLFIGGSFVVGAFGFLAVPFSASLVLVPLIVLSVAWSFGPSSIFYLASKVARPQDSGVAYGVLNACANVGIVFGPFLVGFVRDTTGFYEYALVLIAAFAALGAVTTVGFALSRKRTQLALEG